AGVRRKIRRKAVEHIADEFEFSNRICDAYHPAGLWWNILSCERENDPNSKIVGCALKRGFQFLSPAHEHIEISATAHLSENCPVKGHRIRSAWIEFDHPCERLFGLTDGFFSVEDHRIHEVRACEVV